MALAKYQPIFTRARWMLLTYIALPRELSLSSHSNTLAKESVTGIILFFKRGVLFVEFFLPFSHCVNIFCKSSLCKEKRLREKPHQETATERAWTENSWRSRILSLSTWAICDLTKAGGKKTLKYGRAHSASRAAVVWWRTWRSCSSLTAVYPVLCFPLKAGIILLCKGLGTLRLVWIDAVAYNLLRLSTSEHTCVSILHETQLFGKRWKSWNIAIVSHFAKMLFTKRSKGYNCLVDSTIDRRASSAWSFFADHNLFAVTGVFFSIPQCNCWSGPMKLINKFSSCGPTVKGGQPTTWCRRQRFMFNKLPRWLSAGRHKVDAKSQRWNPWKQSGQSP